MLKIHYSTKGGTFELDFENKFLMILLNTLLKKCQPSFFTKKQRFFTEEQQRLLQLLKKELDNKKISSDNIKTITQKINSDVGEELMERIWHKIGLSIFTLSIQHMKQPKAKVTDLIREKWKEITVDLCDTLPKVDRGDKFSQEFWQQKLTKFIVDSLLCFLNHYVEQINSSLNERKLKDFTLQYFQKAVSIMLNTIETIARGRKIEEYTLTEVWQKIKVGIDIQAICSEYQSSIDSKRLIKLNMKDLLGLLERAKKEIIKVSSEICSSCTEAFSSIAQSAIDIQKFSDRNIKLNYLDEILLNEEGKKLYELVENFLVNVPDDFEKLLNEFIEDVNAQPSKWNVIIPVDWLVVPKEEMRIDNNVKICNGTDEFKEKIRNKQKGERHCSGVKDFFGYQTYILLDNIEARDLATAFSEAKKSVERVLDILVTIDRDQFAPLSLVNVGYIQKSQEAKGMIRDFRESPIQIEYDQETSEMFNIWWTDSKRTSSKKKEANLGEKLFRSLHWYRKGRTDSNLEDRFISYWIALELVTGGSYKYKETVPILLGGMHFFHEWKALEEGKKFRRVYQARKKIKKKIDFLGGEIRSSKLIHAGRIDLPHIDIYAEELREILKRSLDIITNIRDFDKSGKFNSIEAICEEIDSLWGLNGENQ